MRLKHLPTTSSTLSRLREAREELTRLTDVPRANTEIASHYALALLASMNRESHPNDPALRAIFKRQLVERLAGVEIFILDKMVDPTHGFVSTLVFPPSIGEISEWIEAKREPMLRRIDLQMEEIRRLEESDAEAVTEEQRQRNHQMLADVSKVIKETAEAKRKQAMEAMGIEVRQVHDAGALLQSLTNLEDMRKTS